MLVVADARAAGLEAGETAEQRRAAFGMQIGRERPADRLAGIKTEQLEERVVAVGQPAVGGAAEDRIALRIDQALVAGFALVELRVRGRRRRQGVLPAARRRPAAVPPAGRAIRCAGAPKIAVQNEGDDDTDQRSEDGTRQERQLAVQKHIAKPRHEHGGGDQAKENPKTARQYHTLRSPRHLAAALLAKRLTSSGLRALRHWPGLGALRAARLSIIAVLEVF